MTSSPREGQRRSYNGQLCTIKYIGHIPQWPETVALGVEWDDPSRGKHNGEIHGVKYYDVEIEGSGSFIKITKPYDIERTFEEAVQEKYTSNQPNGHSHQFVGLKKQIEYVPDPWQGLAHVSSMSLSGLSLIEKPAPDEKLTANLHNVRRLDLGYNLLSTLDGVFQLCHGLKSLDTLILSGNRLKFNLNRSWPAITELSLSSMNISLADIDKVKSCFCDLQVLCCSNNSLSQWDHSDFKPLNLLDLSYNKFSEIQDTIHDVGHLILSHNRLEVCHLNHCQSVDISHNLIETWSSLRLGNSVRELKIVDNPVFDTPFGTIEGIARYGNLEKLNGTPISNLERTDAEIYFMNNLATDEFKVSERWQQLIDIHGHPKPRKVPNTLKSKTKELTVTFQGQLKLLKILQTMTHQKIKLEAARIWKQNAMKVDLTDENGNFLKEYDEIPKCISLVLR